MSSKHFLLFIISVLKKGLFVAKVVTSMPECSLIFGKKGSGLVTDVTRPNDTCGRVTQVVHFSLNMMIL